MLNRRSFLWLSALGVSTLLGLGCGGAANVGPPPGSKLVWFLNIANGAGDLQMKTVTDAGKQLVFTATPFSVIHSDQPVLSGTTIAYEVTNTGSTFFATSPSTTIEPATLVVASKPAGGSLSGDTVRTVPLPETDKAQLMLVCDGAFGSATTFDVYVTAPGADISTLTPNETYGSAGVVIPLPSTGIVTPLQYQVRLTASGSKDVVADSGTMAGLRGPGYYKVHAFYHNGAAAQHSAYTININGI